MKKAIKHILLFFIALGISSCKEDFKKYGEYKRGETVIGIDPSFLNLGTAFKEVFENDYPEAKIIFKSEPENILINNFINGKIPSIIVSRELTKEEADFLYSKTDVKYIPTQIACDATIFIVSKQSKINKTSVEEIKLGVVDSSGIFVFNSGNSSDFNNIISKLKIRENKTYNVRTLLELDKFIDFIAQNTDQIGVIGLDIISEENSPRVKEILTKIRALPVEGIEGELYYPTIPDIRQGIYPFSKRLYFLNAEGRFLIGSSFVRFIISQRGQLIITRAGLQPYYLFSRKVQIN